ncbi:putative F-box protein At3g16820 [Papaver somniferum]|uniref:putative F-box protein At3g16820 n=1 Tax=Papaver somniferum TaxID=3469 RepID=UPI000E6F7A88|nr:putative F-box protein At3g16820 [Papaver somniferum]
MGNFDMLPSEIISDIFTRLPATLGLEIKRVCKSWEKVAEHPSFFKLHLDLLNQLNSADSENEYKVVRMYKLKEGSKFAQIDVFTLGSDRQWRNEGNIEIEIGMGAWKDGVFANGNIYWNLGEGEIVAFDLADEMFVELPECSGFREIIDDGWNRCIRFGVLGDCLCATHYNTETETSDVWFLEKKQDESLMSWSMGFSLDANTDGYDV